MAAIDPFETVANVSYFLIKELRLTSTDLLCIAANYAE